MKVALAHDHLFQLGGAERVVLEFHKIFPDAPLYTLISALKNGGTFEELDIRTSFLQKMPGAKKHLQYYLSLMPLAWEQLNFNKNNIVLSSTSALAKGIITPPNCLHVCYCHTPTRYLWSDAYNYIEELNQPRIIKKLLPLVLHKLRMWDLFAAQRVDYFIANSHYIKKRIRKYYNKPAHVIYPPVNVEQYRTSKNIKDYYIIVSRLRPYKKVDLAIRAFNELGLPLIVIGSGEEYNKLKKLARSNIKLLGEVSEEKKIQLLSQAKAFIHPQVEDFGIAAVEAMAAGRPVIAYNEGGATETVIDGQTGVLYDEQSWECLVHTILKFDHTEFDSEVIRNHANKFNATRFREEIEDYISKVWQDHNNQTII